MQYALLRCVANVRVEIIRTIRVVRDTDPVWFIISILVIIDGYVICIIFTNHFPAIVLTVAFCTEQTTHDS